MKDLLEEVEGIIVLLGVLFAILRLTGAIHWHWAWVLSPFIFIIGFLLVYGVVDVAITILKAKKK